MSGMERLIEVAVWLVWAWLGLMAVMVPLMVWWFVFVFRRMFRARR